MNIYRSFFSFLLLSVKPKTVLSTSVTNNVTQHPPKTLRINYDPLTFRDISPRLTLQETINDKGELECVLCNKSTLPFKCV